MALPPLAELRCPVDAETRALLEGGGVLAEGGAADFRRIHVEQARIEEILGLAPGCVVYAEDGRLLRPARGARGEGGYHDAAAVLLRLETWVGANPDRVEVVDLGTSVEGRPIRAARFFPSDGAVRPALRVIGGHHGDEWASIEVALAFGDTLAAPVDPRAARLVQAFEIWVVPDLNPDGHEAFDRRNARGIDLNRNYPFEWTQGFASGAEPFSEPETQAIAALSRRRAFLWSVSIHSGATNLGWPWNWTLDAPEDLPIFESMGARYAESVGQPGFWTTQGSAWYITRGDTNDWSYGAFGGFDHTLEVSVEKAPPEEELGPIRLWHGEALLAWFDEATRAGARGLMLDRRGAAAPRSVAPPGGRATWADPWTGAFFRPLSGTQDSLAISQPSEPAVLELDVPPRLGELVDVGVVPVFTIEPGTVSVVGGGRVADRFVAALSWRTPPPEKTRVFAERAEQAPVELLRNGSVDRWVLSAPVGLLGAPADAGPWDLHVRTADGESLLWRPGALWRLDQWIDLGLSIEALDGGALTLQLDAPLPLGPAFWVQGPSGQRLADSRIEVDSAGGIVRLDVQGVEKGLWTLRVAAGGRWMESRDALRLGAGTAALVPLGPAAGALIADRRSPWVPEEGTPTDDPPARAESPVPPPAQGSGCDGGAALLALALVRRRATLRRGRVCGARRP